MSQVLDQEGEVSTLKEDSCLTVFYPELLGQTALSDLLSTLDHLQKMKAKVHVLTYFCSVWALQELKDHPLFKAGSVHVFTLSLNDKLREFPML